VGDENVVQEVGDEGLECDRVLEEGEDIEEGDSLNVSTYRLDRDVVEDLPSWESRGGHQDGI
jgi:hypothetical protein